MVSEKLCGEIVKPFVTAVNDDKNLVPVQIIGGNGSAALADPLTRFLGCTIDAPKACDLSRFREDGSVRDLDVLVLSTDPDEVAAIEKLAIETVDGLEISVFGLKTCVQLANQRGHTWASTAKVWVGDRYVESIDEIDEGEFVVQHAAKALFPFAAPIDGSSLETYYLYTGQDGEPTPTSHPAATVLNYLTRSVSGVRPKDAKKLPKIADNVFKHPEMREWIIDGPGATTFQLARILHTLREPRSHPRTLELGEYLKITPLRMSDLTEHPFFMGHNLSSAGQHALVEAARFKARALHLGESQERLVSVWQKHVEQRINAIVHND